MRLAEGRDAEHVAPGGHLASAAAAKRSPWLHSASQVGQLMHPAEIAQAYVMLHQQPPTVWSHELQISTPKTNLGMRL